MKNHHCYLKSMTREDVMLFQKWISESVFWGEHLATHAIPLEHLLSDFDATQGWQSDEMYRWLVMNEKNEAVGFVHCWKFDKFENHFEFGRVIHPTYRGKGYGLISLHLVIEKIFTITSAHRAQAITTVDNTANLKCWEKLGIQVEGRLRQYSMIEGVPRDCFLGSMLKSDWNA